MARTPCSRLRAEFGPPVMDTIGPITVRAHGRPLLDAGNAIRGLSVYWKSGLLAASATRRIDIIVRAGGPPQPSVHERRPPRPHHGAGNRPARPIATAVGQRDAQYDLDVIGQWATPADSAQHTPGRAASGRFEPLLTGSVYFNHLAADDR